MVIKLSLSNGTELQLPGFCCIEYVLSGMSRVPQLRVSCGKFEKKFNKDAVLSFCFL